MSIIVPMGRTFVQSFATLGLLVSELGGNLGVLRMGRRENEIF